MQKGSTNDAKRVLFVDDEQNIRLTLPRSLARHGFEVISAASVQEAVVEIKVDRSKFDILLCDLNLREVNDGFAVIEEMRKTQPWCMAVVLTGHPSNDSFQRAVVGQVARYFIKPVEIDDLVEAMKEELARSSQPALPEATSSHVVTYFWQQPVLDAFMEIRADRLALKINAAERAISTRLQLTSPIDIVEQAALHAALRSLEVLVREQRKGKEESDENKEGIA